MTPNNKRTRQSWGKSSGPRVGFYGCRRGVVRVMFEPGEEPDEPSKYPRSLRVTCPGCGHEHRVAPAWRKHVESIDAGKHVDVVLAGEEALA